MRLSGFRPSLTAARRAPDPALPGRPVHPPRERSDRRPARPEAARLSVSPSRLAKLAERGTIRGRCVITGAISRRKAEPSGDRPAWPRSDVGRIARRPTIAKSAVSARSTPLLRDRPGASCATFPPPSGGIVDLDASIRPRVDRCTAPGSRRDPNQLRAADARRYEETVGERREQPSALPPVSQEPTQARVARHGDNAIEGPHA